MMYDLLKRRMSIEHRIKDTATPIDNITKFAWDDYDYEDVEVYIPYTEEELSEMNALNPDDDRDQMLIDQEYRLTLLELGLV